MDKSKLKTVNIKITNENGEEVDSFTSDCAFVCAHRVQNPAEKSEEKDVGKIFHLNFVDAPRATFCEVFQKCYREIFSINFENFIKIVNNQVRLTADVKLFYDGKND